MKFHNLHIIAILTFIINVRNSSEARETLRAVQIVYRHGDRNPMKPYPNDPYNNLSYWPEGWGILTAKGKLQLYNLGRYMRKRYPNFQRKNVAIFTSDTNRTITSAMANLAGFYGQNRSILKQLEHMDPKRYGGIQVVQKEDDDFIMSEKPCARWDEAKRNLFQNSEIIDDFKQRNRHALEIINRNTGLDFTSTMGFDLIYVVDTLLIQRGRNLELPVWAEELYKSGKLDEIRDFFFVALLHTLELKRLKTGTMVKKFINQMESVILETNNKNSSERDFGPNITIISAHDATVAFWLTDLNIFDGKSPIYASAIFMELSTIYDTDFHSFGKNYIFKVYYKNETDSDHPYLMSIPGCPNPCNFDTLKTLLSPIVVDNREEECKLRETPIYRETTKTTTNKDRMQNLRNRTVTDTSTETATSAASKGLSGHHVIGAFMIFLLALVIITLTCTTLLCYSDTYCFMQNNEGHVRPISMRLITD